MTQRSTGEALPTEPARSPRKHEFQKSLLASSLIQFPAKFKTFIKLTLKFHELSAKMECVTYIQWEYTPSCHTGSTLQELLPSPTMTCTLGKHSKSAVRLVGLFSLQTLSSFTLTLYFILLSRVCASLPLALTTAIAKFFFFLSVTLKPAFILYSASIPTKISPNLVPTNSNFFTDNSYSTINFPFDLTTFHLTRSQWPPVR